MRIRENEKLGVFVEGLEKFSINSYTEFEDILSEGNENKTIAST